MFGPPPLKDADGVAHPRHLRAGISRPGVLVDAFLSGSPGAARGRRVTPRLQTFFSDLMVAHEVAHQWWGNVVMPKSYQDEWLLEALAHYSALLWLEKKKGSKALEEVMADFQADLLKTGDDSQTVESAGPITWGYRLEASKNNRSVSRNHI